MYCDSNRILASAVSSLSMAGEGLPRVTSLRPNEPLTSIAHAVSGGSLVRAAYKLGRF
jgi:hypothetical protein